MRILIVDDEKQIREGLKILVATIKGTEVIGEASTIEEAKEKIETLQPDLVLLDIQIKDKTGFDMLDTLSGYNFKLIFVTAYNEYAIKAFKYNAFDYLLKPVDPEELEAAIERLKEQTNHNQKQLSILKENKELNRIIIKTTEQIYVLDLSEIVHCKADQGYTHFYTKHNKHILSSKTLKEYNELLPKEQFIRVHQSHLVNWEYVSSFDKKGELILKNEERIPVSVRRRHIVSERF
ncbi:LytR/AlgR family response regulator transcription factor [Tenacibaculum sp. TC6]|uniref:LytR/AlgR family response regulator transcription factor n=1 Tax=Tenacibaculum sp. TC6 TaxID=3423223 RepID=UPI003D360A13